MTILYPKRFQEANTAGNDGVFDWDFLKEAWAPTKIEPMDFDAVVERFCRFLVFETKQPGVAIRTGQRVALENAVRTGRFTVIVIYAKRPEDITGFEIWWAKELGEVEKTQKVGTYRDVIEWSRRWFQMASNAPPGLIEGLVFDKCASCGQPIAALQID